jgi:hypothetical protein
VVVVGEIKRRGQAISGGNKSETEKKMDKEKNQNNRLFSPMTVENSEIAFSN